MLKEAITTFLNLLWRTHKDSGVRRNSVTYYGEGLYLAINLGDPGHAPPVKF